MTFSGLKTGLLFLLLMAVTLPANAEDAWYLRLQGGGNFAGDQDIDGILGTTFARQSEFSSGYVAGVALGHGFGPIRLEGEFLYRENDVDGLVGGPGMVSGDRSIRSFTANVLYDFYSLTLSPDRSLDLYVGAGLGIANVSFNGVAEGGAALLDADDSVFAYQAIFGVSHALSDRLSINLDYRYLTTVNPEFVTAAATNVETEVADHSVLFGLTWHFGAKAKTKTKRAFAKAAEPAARASAARASAAPVAADKKAVTKKTFLVFFDWDQAIIRQDAVEILTEAAAVARHGTLAIIQLTGHADRSGTRRYNQSLSERRAAAVQRFLIGKGVPADIIATFGKGEDDLLVATPDNVREPRNRRVEIVLP
ncbi:OmpA family protein [Rhodospirillaceae bacterium AH-315-P19]|nr:OmpA family protein [Rhodospirillaceae bacterium AH-315-P19]